MSEQNQEFENVSDYMDFLAEHLRKQQETAASATMSERSCIAAMAMQGILSSAESILKHAKIAEANGIESYTLVAASASKYADALLAELGK